MILFLIIQVIQKMKIYNAGGESLDLELPDNGTEIGFFNSQSSWCIHSNKK